MLMKTRTNETNRDGLPTRGLSSSSSSTNTSLPRRLFCLVPRRLRRGDDEDNSPRSNVDPSDCDCESLLSSLSSPTINKVLIKIGVEKLI